MRRKRKVPSIPRRGYLAGYTSTGKVWVNPAVPKRFHRRLKIHERTEYRLRKQGMSYKAAHRQALKAESKGMSCRQVQSYSGKLGAIVRWVLSGKKKRKR